MNSANAEGVSIPTPKSLHSTALPDKVSPGVVTYPRHVPSIAAREARKLHSQYPGVVYDWGCGTGFDVGWLWQHGVPSVGWDPYQADHAEMKPSLWRGKLGIITCAHVLNTLTPELREAALLGIAHLAGTGTPIIICVPNKKTVDRDARRLGWKPMDDGYLTGRKKFMAGFTLTSLSSELERTGWDISYVRTVDKETPCLMVTI